MTASPLRIPKHLDHEAREIFKLTDPFCAEHLDAEYAELCRSLVARLARKRPSPLDRGNLNIWAASVIYTVGSVIPLGRLRFMDGAEQWDFQPYRFSDEYWDDRESEVGTPEDIILSMIATRLS